MEKGRNKVFGREFKFSNIFKTAVFVITLVFGIYPNTVFAEKPIVLKGVSAFPKSHPVNASIPAFIDMVNKESNGKLSIKWVGGPEVMKAFDQIDALKAGIVDILLFMPCGYFKPILPAAEIMGLSEYPAWKEREIGAYELWDKLFKEKANAKFLGRFVSDIPYHIYCNPKISNLGDLKGLNIRVMPLYVPFVKSLGASPVTLSAMEIYTAMQRHVVDGFIWPAWGVTGLGWHEVTKYMVEPGVFQLDPIIVVNLNKWNKIPKKLQATLNDCMKKMERVATDSALKKGQQEMIIMEKAGMKKTYLSPEDSRKFRALAYEATWKELIKKAPIYGPQFKKILSK